MKAGTFLENLRHIHIVNINVNIKINTKKCEGFKVRNEYDLKLNIRSYLTLELKGSNPNFLKLINGFFSIGTFTKL